MFERAIPEIMISPEFSDSLEHVILHDKFYRTNVYLFHVYTFLFQKKMF